MALLADLDAKRVEMNNAIDAYKQAVQDFNSGSITQTQLDNAKIAAQNAADDFAKTTAQVKSDNPGLANNDFFSNPTLQTPTRQDFVAQLLRYGKLPGMEIVIDTEAKNAGAATADLSILPSSDFEIDWGDGTVEQGTDNITHTYATPGVYTVVLSGRVAGFAAAPASNMEFLIKDIRRWGGLKIDSYEQMFQYRQNFTISASDAPKFKTNESLMNMFYRSVFVGANIGHWDTSNVVNMSHMFFDVEEFTGDIGSWDVSNVTNFESMFADCTAFNSNLSAWKPTSALSMQSMFEGAIAFNQDISAWPVGTVTNFRRMFYEASAFNQPLNAWNMSSAIDTSYMFYLAAAFNQPLNLWNTGSVTTMTQMFRFASVFDQDISMWDVSNVQYYGSFADFSPIDGTAKEPNFIT